MELLVLLLPLGHVIELVIDLINGGGDVVQLSDGLAVGSVIFPAHPVEDSSDDGSEDEAACTDQLGDHDATLRFSSETSASRASTRLASVTGCGVGSMSASGWKAPRRTRS